MNKIILLAVASLSFSQANSQIQELKDAQDVRRKAFPSTNTSLSVNPATYVNPFIGTGGHGHTFPGAVVPFGMVQPGPDTRYEGWDGCSGYHYSDSVIYGFSQTHLSGTGIPDYSDLLVVPQVGKAALTGKYKDPKGYGARFSHQTETATPGYYKVSLINPNVDVSLTATKRCAIHRYTFFTTKEKKFVVLDLGYRDKVLDAGAKVYGNNEVKGFRISQAWAANQSFFFDLQTNVPFSSSKVVLDKKKNSYVVVLEFPKEVKEVLVRIGVSGTDEAGASANLAAEAPHWEFNQYVKAASSMWSAQLGAVIAQSEDKTILTNLYTALYHAYIHPSVWTDVDGRYRDFNNKIRSSSSGDIYSVFSIWDTYRAANPLYTILQPKLTTQIVESYYQQYRDMGTLPVWTLSNNETYCMIGYHAVSVISDALKKNIPVNNKEELLDAMIATSSYNHFGKVPYAKNGFVAANEDAESVSKTLEYAYDDWCISQYAKTLGKDSIAAVYEKRSESWMNLYNPETGFFQAREGGMWLTNFQPNEVNHHFTEANAWQYSLAVPQNFGHLTQLKGGKENMESFLDSLFHTSSEMSGREQADITGLIGQYAHGNEPSHHMAYLYNYVGAPHKTQELLDQIMRAEYRNQPDGLAGNEDCGQMSAWYVLSSLGFYPVCPGSGTYAIGKPMIDRVSVKTTGIFAVEAINNSPSNKYIQSIKWNGEAYRKLFITHEMIVKGGLLTIDMGPVPNPDLADYETDLPQNKKLDVIAAPYFAAKGKVFSEKAEVTIEKLPGETGTIYYTTDGSEPDIPSTVFDGKLLSFYESTTLKARIIRLEQSGFVYGPVVSTDFIRFIQDKTISLAPQYANQYSGGSEGALIDGQSGGLDYRSVGWQGFQEEDVVASLALNEAKDITKVSVNALQDTKSWIFYPKSFTVEVSEDGKSFKKVGTQVNKSVSDKLEGTLIRSMELEFAPVKAKFVRVTVRNYGLCPDWHLGAGGKTWIFLDEIQVQ